MKKNFKSSVGAPDIPVGAKVVILSDVRENGDAAGKVGVYKGMHPIPAAWFRGSEATPDKDDAFLNPLIELEDGSTIWGIECWWRALTLNEEENGFSAEDLKKEADKLNDFMENLSAAVERAETERAMRIIDEGYSEPGDNEG